MLQMPNLARLTRAPNIFIDVPPTDQGLSNANPEMKEITVLMLLCAVISLYSPSAPDTMTRKILFVPTCSSYSFEL